MKIAYASEYGVRTTERLKLDHVDDELAHEHLNLITDAYEAQFENPTLYDLEQIPQGTIRNHFMPDSEDHVHAHRLRIERFLRRGSTYWRQQERTAAGQKVIGLIKLSPAPSSFEVANISVPAVKTYISDIVVSPAHWNKGIGSELLYTALRNNAHPRQRVSLDAFIGSSVTKWYERLGFEAVPDTSGPDMLLIGSQHLPLRSYETPAEVSAENLANHLKEGYPHLTSAVRSIGC